MKMEITKISISQIIPNKFNPNAMPGGTFKKLLLSIKKFGLFNPIIVRKIEDGYEIIDGEQRYKGFIALKYIEIPCRIIEATDEEVKQMIFATTIKGRHNAYDSREVLKGFLDKTNSDTLSACNLDNVKLQRKTKYIDYDKGEAVQKGKRKLADESIQCKTIDQFISILAIPLKKEDYDTAILKLKVLDKDISKAFMKLIKESI